MKITWLVACFWFVVRPGTLCLCVLAPLHTIASAPVPARRRRHLLFETDESIQAMDSHLASLLQKKHDLKKAWRKNKLNRHLRTKIADLGREIESHAKTLCAQQWNNTCDEADGKMRKGSKRGLLKHLMADSDKPTRGGTQLQIERLVHKHAQDSGGPLSSKRLAKNISHWKANQ
ncbi:hypothetical protein HPB51_007778 [Rhipicephalus microplus]|uniref:Uncharacterized protein n=1 Tax=Rhipicephalus microplus TaxID=6941 RepID=A0A9J6EYP5_RHIMP|nr:hypothetical protein HPB51_007778 [Rhipicephalus microplus]